jgi:hypothetical protein
MLSHSGSVLIPNRRRHEQKQHFQPNDNDDEKDVILLKSFSFIDAFISNDQDEGDENYNNHSGDQGNNNSNSNRNNRKALDTQTFPAPDQANSASMPFPQQQMMAPLPQEEKQKQQQNWVERFYEKRGPPPPAPLLRPPLVRLPTVETQIQTQMEPSFAAVVPQQQSHELQTEILAEVKDIWDTSAPIAVHGCQSLRTWKLKSKQMSSVQVLLRTEGRPLNANVDVWYGPDNTPFKLSLYVEDGNERPFSAIIATPHSSFGSTVAVRNTAETMEFPLQACVQADFSGYIDQQQRQQESYHNSASSDTNYMTLSTLPRQLWERTMKRKTVQGNGAVYVQAYGPEVDKVEILLTTEMRPLNARIEVLQGPNNIKQVMEVFSEDGQSRPFYCVLETPGTGNVIRVVNTADLEFPMDVCIGPFYGGGGDHNGFDEDDDSYDEDNTNFERFFLPSSQQRHEQQRQRQQHLERRKGRRGFSAYLTEGDVNMNNPSSPFLSP